ncbi:hypothetical protein HY440_01450 [Candidatus Microgenomates bacterium]|nr:hypothetical protein [Candidatus Microgenomates bacterium]
MKKKDILINESRIVAVVNAVNAARERRDYPFDSAALHPPEEKFVGWLKEHDDSVFATNALFLLTTMVFADNSETFFRIKLGNKSKFQENAWIFDVQKALSSPKTEEAATAYFTPGYNRVAIDDWRHNCQVISDQYKGDIHNFFSECDDDALKVVQVLENNAKVPGKPGLRRYGHKLARMFVGWTQLYGLHDFKNVDKIGIPVDFHVVALLRQTGGILFSDPTPKDIVGKEVVNPLMMRLCVENKWKPTTVSENLWQVGSKGCNNLEHQRCPIAHLCYRMMSREQLDTKGLFDPADTGRWLTRRERIKFRDGVVWLFDPNSAK